MKRLASICVALAQAVAVCHGAATDLFDAVRVADAEKVKLLLQAEPNLAEARTEDSITALHLAALEGQAAIVRLLLASQAQVNARGLREETPLHMAMYDGHREVAELLLASRAEVNAQNTAGETPLHLAARKGYRELVELLLEHHADVNAKGRQEATALHAAAAGGHKEVVELLLSQNADLGARDKSGRTPKAAAAQNGHWEIVELLTPRVDQYHDLQRFVFEGAKAFSATALRQALKRTRDFFEISHPLAPRDAFLEAIEGRLLLGYQHHGFPKAQVEARHDAKAARILVKVVEGPRYVCSEVKVTGPTNVPAAAIVERLMPSQAATQSVQQAFEFQDKAPATNPLTEDSPEDESGAANARWVKGERAPLSNVDRRQMKARVTDVLRKRGFLFPEVNLTVTPNTTTRAAELRVEVPEAGARGVIDRIEVTGARKNSAEAVLRYLGLKPGMELSSQLVARTEDRLWRTARFLSYQVNLGSPDTGGRVPLQIQVVEYDKAPPLDKAFSRTEEAMLKLREWLSKLDESGEEMIVNLSGFPAPAPFELALPPVACVGLAHRGDCSSWFEGDVLSRSNATMLFKLNGNTGRLIEFRKASDEGRGTVQLRCEPRAFGHAVRRIETEAASLPDGCATNALLSSAVAFLAEELISSKYVQSLLGTNLSSETAAPLPGMLRQFRLAEILEPLNRLLGEPDGLAEDEGVFAIPVDREVSAVARGDTMGLAASWLLQHGDEIFAAHSWPWTVLREASFTVHRHRSLALRSTGVRTRPC